MTRNTIRNSKKEIKQILIVEFKIELERNEVLKTKNKNPNLINIENN